MLDQYTGYSDEMLEQMNSVSLIGGEWDIAVLGLSVVSVDKSWLEGVTSVVIWPILDLVGRGGSNFLFGSILDLSLGELSGVWDLSGSDFGLGLGLDGVLNFVVYDLNVTEKGLFAVLGVAMFVSIIA